MPTRDAEPPGAGERSGERPPAEAAAGLQEEPSLRGSPTARAAGAALLALSRAARSFTLYDPANKVVRALIGDYRAKMRAALERHGALAFDVHPFELLLGKEVVYLERDRERSLAFRLFRDGVRQIAFSPSVPWEELLHLLEVFSIRYTGVRQQEDDLVTLLRRAGFTGITTSAVEGFVPDEELAEDAVPGDLSGRPAARFQLPPEWDLPLPDFDDAADPEYRPVPPERLAALRAEEQPEALAANARRAVAELLRALGSSPRGGVLAFATEVRDLLLVEGRADLLLELVGTIHETAPASPERLAFVRGLLDDNTLKALVLGQPEGALEIPGALAEAIDLSGRDVLELLLELLGQAGPRAPLVRKLVARAAIGAPEQLLSRARDADPEIAATLLGALRDVDPRGALRAELALASRAAPPAQLAILDRLRGVAFDAEIARTLRELIASPAESVRVRALGMLAAGGQRAFPTLLAHLEKRANEATQLEAEAAGRAMADASPDSALDAFEAWLHPKGGGLLGRFVGLSTPKALQRAALGGLAQIAGEDAEALLKHLAARGADELRRPAADELAARARERGGGRARG